MGVYFDDKYIYEQILEFDNYEVREE